MADVASMRRALFAQTRIATRGLVRLLVSYRPLARVFLSLQRRLGRVNRCCALSLSLLGRQLSYQSKVCASIALTSQRIYCLFLKQGPLRAPHSNCAGGARESAARYQTRGPRFRPKDCRALIAIMSQEAKRDEPPPPPSYDLESNMSSMSDSNIGFRPVARQRSESQLPPHWSRRATPPQTRPVEKIRSTTMRFLDNFTRSSSTLDPDGTRTASVKDKQIMRCKDKQNRLVDRLDAFAQSRGKIRHRAAARVQ